MKNTRIVDTDCCTGVIVPPVVPLAVTLSGGSQVVPRPFVSDRWCLWIPGRLRARHHQQRPGGNSHHHSDNRCVGGIWISATLICAGLMSSVSSWHRPASSRWFCNDRSSQMRIASVAIDGYRGRRRLWMDGLRSYHFSGHTSDKYLLYPKHYPGVFHHNLPVPSHSLWWLLMRILSSLIIFTVAGLSHDASNTLILRNDVPAALNEMWSFCPPWLL